MNKTALNYLLDKQISYIRRVRIEGFNDDIKLMMEAMSQVHDSHYHYRHIEKYPIEDVFRNIISVLSIPFELRNKLRVLANDSGFQLPGDNDFPVIVNMEIQKGIIAQMDDLDIISDKIGLYLPTLNIIVIDCDKITEICREKDFSIYYEDVLLHELGHWFSQEVLIDDKHWDDELFKKNSKDIKEFWAQIIEYHLISDKDLKRHQKAESKKLSPPYNLFLNYLKKDKRDVLQLLKHRELDNWADLKVKLDGLNNVIEKNTQKLGFNGDV